MSQTKAGGGGPRTPEKLKIADSLMYVLRASSIASRNLPEFSAQFTSRFYQMSLVGELPN